MRSFVISTKYKADATQFVKEQSRMGRSFGSFARQMADGNSFVGRSFGTLNKSINRVAMFGMAALVAGAGLAAREFVNLDNSITAAGAKFTDIDSTSTTFKDNLALLSQAARAVGADTEFSATDAAGALDKMAMAGLTSVQSMDLLRGTTDLATAAGTDLTTAVDIATDSIGAFNVEANKANLDKISDQMAKVTTTANTDLPMLFEAIKAGAPAFRAAGQEISTFNSLVGVMANAGIKGSESGTSLRNMALRLADPTAEAAKIMKKLGVQVKDEHGNFRDFIDIIGDFEKGLKGMGEVQKTAALSTVFGARSVTGFNILLNQGAEALDKYRDSIEASDGSAKNMAAAIRTSLGNQIKVLQSGLVELGLKFVEAFEKDGRGALQFLIDFVQKFDVKPLISFSRAIVTVFTFLASNWRLLLALAAGIKAVAITMGILNIVTSVFGKQLQASPIGMIITLVFLLTTAIIWAIANWDKIVAVLKIAWEWIKSVGIAIKDFAISAWDFLITKLIQGVGWFKETWQQISFLAGPLGILASMIAEVVKQWDKIKLAFSEKGIGSGIMAIGSALVSGLLIPLQSLLELAAKIPGLGGLAAGGAEKIQELRNSLMGNDIAAIGGAQTPTPEFPRGAAARSGGAGRIDININNQAGENADIKQSGNMPTGTRVNFAPAVSY